MLQIVSIPDSSTAWIREFIPSNRRSSFKAADKLQLTQEQARSIAARLRKAAKPKPGQPVVRLFRYGIDDLRLFKALEVAGLEGRVVVVDTLDFADAVLTTRSKRTGKNVDLSVARRAAASADVPCLVLPAVSAQRLLEALGPLLGLPGVQAGGEAVAGKADWQPAGVSRLGRHPHFLAWEDLDEDAAQQLGHLLRQLDVEDNREQLVPANPTARLGARYTLRRPSRHYSRIHKRRLQRHLSLKEVSW
eukprot:gene10374-10532_t